jgi:tetratricopeptide (TPR) repeat protein
MDEVLFHQHNCAWRGGDLNKASAILKELNARFAQSRYTALLNGQESKEAQQKSKNFDSIYTEIYTLFTKGSYEQAVELKKQTDQIAGNNHWTPQLLYIEAIYYVKQKQDSTAIRLLRELQLRFPASPLYIRAADLLDAIIKRANLEASVTHPTAPATPASPQNNPATPTNITNQNSSNTPYTWDEQSTHLALFVMEETEPVLAAEAMRSIDNYNRSAFNNRSFQKELINLDSRYRIVAVGLFGNFQEASGYLNQVITKTSNEIVPWLPAVKYKWLPISVINLNELRQRKDLDVYQRFLNSKRP